MLKLKGISLLFFSALIYIAGGLSGVKVVKAWTGTLIFVGIALKMSIIYHYYCYYFLLSD